MLREICIAKFLFMKLYLFLLAVLILQSCSEPSQKHPFSEVNDKTIALKENSYRLNYAAIYNKRLTINETANIVDRLATDASMKYNRITDKTASYEVAYGWKTDSKMEMHSVEMPEHIICVTGIQGESLKGFKRDYAHRTEKEIAALNKQVSKQLDGKSGREKTEAAKKEMNDLGVSVENGKNTAKNIGRALALHSLLMKRCPDSEPLRFGIQTIKPV